MSEMGVRTYVAVPQQPRRNWEGKREQQAAVYANRRRVKDARGKRLLRRRGELLERPFAHQYETGAMRRLHVRGRGNVAKRVLLQAAAFNLALILRTLTRAGTPRGLADLKRKLFCALWRVLAALSAIPAPLSGLDESSPLSSHLSERLRPNPPTLRRSRKSGF
jgi:transposase